MGKDYQPPEVDVILFQTGDLMTASRDPWEGEEG